MKKGMLFTSVALSGVLCLAALPAQAFAKAFSDVDPTAWYATGGYVDYVSANKYMTGYPGTDLFKPNETITRAEAASALYRTIENLADDPSTYFSENLTPFTDVETGTYYINAVTWLYMNGVVTGYDGTTLFAPNSPITREEFISMIGRAVGRFYPDGVTNSNGANLAKFDDADDISSWATANMAWSVDIGIISGYPVDFLGKGSEAGAVSWLIAPNQCASRAEVAKMLTIFQRDYITKYNVKIYYTW